MSPMQEAELTQGGDCFLHWHSEDRRATHDLLHGLQGTASVISQSASYSLSLKDDYHLVTTTSGVVVVTLPKARGNRLITIVRVAGANNITLSPTSPETINGAASLAISASYTPVRLIALQGVGYVQV